MPSSSRFTIHPMYRLALRMLIGDRAKYLSLVFAIAFSSFLIAQQISVFFGLMDRTRSQVKDVTDADIWVMDPATRYVDEVYPLKASDLYRVRGVDGVRWAVPFFKGLPTAKAPNGTFRVVILLGLDDPSLTGAPTSDKMLLGKVDDLRQPDTAIIDRAGYHFFFPNQPLSLGKKLELNDHLVKIVGVAEASAPFTTFPVMYSRYTEAIDYVGRQRSQLSFVLVGQQPGITTPELVRRIQLATGLQAVSTEDFGWMTIWYYVKNTGIPVNFSLTVIIAVLVGTVVSGQTFYIFTLENLKQFAALKALGTSNSRIVGMVLLQAVTVGAIGLSVGLGLTALFFVSFSKGDATRGFILIWQVAAATCAGVFGIVSIASLLSLRKVIRLEPAFVFRG